MSPAVSADVLDGVEALLRGGGNARPPIDDWQPPFSGDIDIRIARDGTWHHEGEPFARESLVRLFSTILRREGDDYFLVTPAEKWRLRVEDAPFVAIDCEVLGEGRGQQLVFVTGVDDRVLCDAAHPLRVDTDPASGEPSPYVEIRRGLEARLSRSVFYRLAERAVEHGGAVGVWSGGSFFPLG